MGPRLKDVEDFNIVNDIRWNKAALQWGHVSRTWKTRPLGLGVGQMLALQWGHVSRTWKTSIATAALLGLKALQWGHVSRTWKTRPPLAVHGYLSSASMGPRLKDVEDVESANGVRESLDASMGPRLKDVEDRVKEVRCEGLPTGFNGATSQGRGRLLRTEAIDRTFKALQWGHVSRTWKTRPGTATRPLRRTTLQWGHVSRTWKTCVSTTDVTSMVPASMGPRLKDVEDHRLPRTPRRSSRRFNGATSQGRGRLVSVVKARAEK